MLRGRQPFRRGRLAAACGGAALALVAMQADGQVFGGNPPSLRWNQINTDAVRVIFPQGSAIQARAVAQTMDWLSRDGTASIGERRHKVDVVLQSQTMEANGMVTLSPFHAVLHLTPPVDNFSLGSGPWLRLLAIHEYRHVQQNLNFRSGIGRTFHTLFGENGQALVTNALIPDWFWEGDAVFMETALSGQGRGRLPSFLRDFRALQEQGQTYSYAKIRNGSYRDLVPDHYQLGYLMCAYGRDTLGQDFWRDVLQETLLNSRRPGAVYPRLRYGLYPLSAALRYHSGSRIPGFYRKALDHFSRRWDAADSAAETAVVTVRENMGRAVLHYRYPQFDAQGRLYAMKQGYAYTPRIVRLDSAGREEVVARLGEADYFSVGGDRLVWAEARPDPRWGWKDYSVIMVQDLLTGRRRRLSARSRYATPALSADGKQIVAVTLDSLDRSTLVLLDAMSGKIRYRLPNPGGFFYTYPSFAPGGRSLVAAVRDSSGRMALLRQFLDGVQQVITPWSSAPLGPPRELQGYIYYSAAYTDRVQLFAWSEKEGRIRRVASRPAGDYSLSVDTARQRVVFDEYGLRGYRLLAVPWTPARWPLAEAPLDLPDRYVPRALAAEGPPMAGEPLPDYPITRYRPLKHLMNIHSWSLWPEYPRIGLYVQSQDVLNTLQWKAGGGYHVTEHSPYVSVEASYGGWFPQWQAGYIRYFGRQAYAAGGQRLRWDEDDAYAGVSLPLDLSSGLYSRYLSTGVWLHRNAVHFRPASGAKDPEQRWTYLEENLQFSNGRRSARQQVFPSFGQALSLRYRHAIDPEKAQEALGALSLYFPGLHRTHSLYLRAALGIRDTARHYIFTDDFVYAPGYNSVPYKRIVRLGLHYQLPLAYPDAGLTWAYLLRIRADLFFVYSQASLQPGLPVSRADFRSLGATLLLDTRWFSYLPVAVGLRYSYLLDKDYGDPGRQQAFEFFIPLTIF